MQRIPLLLATLSLLPSCATEVATTNTQQAATAYVAEGRRCDPNFCILFTAQDSDHDGVADEDELAAGTDPNDPTKYPTMIQLATLMAKHQLPTFEIGNSLMVLVPTRDANGLPVFGGEASLPTRKSGLETAGIKVPDGIDLSRGFTMSRTVASSEMSFGQLFTAFGREDKGTIPVRLLADAIGWNPSGDWDVTGSKGEIDGPGESHGTLKGETKDGTDLLGHWSMDGDKTYVSVVSDDEFGSFRQDIVITKNADGSVTTETHTVTVIGEPHTTTLGGVFADYKDVKTTSTKSADGRHTTTTTTTQYVHTDPLEVQKSKPRTTTTECTDSVCSEPPPPQHTEEGGDHEDTGDDGNDHDGYMDPEAAEHSGVITATPEGMRTAIAKLQTTVRVVPNDNDPLSNYEVPPTGVHDAWGPIALYGGDPENATLVGSFGLTPAFVRVPQPEYDPNLQEQKPPMGVPPDRSGCLYCSQPPAR